MDLFHPQGMKAMSEVVADCTASHSCDAVLILGVTNSGRTFRPSDWVDRLAGRFSTFCRDRRLKYSLCVRPLTVEGLRGLLVDIRLVESDPGAFRFLMDFAVDNDLLIRCLGGTVREDSWPYGVAALLDVAAKNRLRHFTS
jgi:hypothetical protein